MRAIVAHYQDLARSSVFRTALIDQTPSNEVIGMWPKSSQQQPATASVSSIHDSATRTLHDRGKRNGAKPMKNSTLAMLALLLFHSPIFTQQWSSDPVTDTLK